MTDPLGQSQVLPYLVGLSKMGYSFHIVSFEKKEKYGVKCEDIFALCRTHGIQWHPIGYTKYPKIFSTIFDLYKMRRRVFELIKEFNIELIHCRSYLPVFSAIKAKNKFDSVFIFDMRGYWPDERLEGGIWTLSNPLYKLVYQYFKKKEKIFINAADHIVSLTKVAMKDLVSVHGISNKKISVIPCAADFEHFSLVDPDKKKSMRSKMGFSEEDLIIGYLGSIGTWYLLDEMLEFLERINAVHKSLKILFITADPKELIIEKAKRKGLDENIVKVIYVDRQELSDTLDVLDLGIFFIKPSFSKRASSPTKMGEMLAKGIPLIANGGVGDVEMMLKDMGSGIVVDNSDNESWRIGIKAIPQLLNLESSEIRRKAALNLDLKSAIQEYHLIYQGLLKN